jgi:hypothetical protein
MGDQDDNKPDGGEPTPSEPPSNPELPPADAPTLSPASPVAASTAPEVEPKAESVSPPAPDIEPKAAIAAPAAAAPEPKVEPAAPAPSPPAPRQRRLLAAGIGGAIAAYATASWISAQPPQPDVAGIEERKALQQSIAQLSKQVATLKADLDKSNKLAFDKFNKIAADLASKPASSPIIKSADRVDIGKSAEITGTIPAPAAAAPAAAPATVAVPMPTPRPATRVAAATIRPVVLQDWWIYDARGGYIFVAGHGEIYQAIPGAPLPGLGTVQAIKREDGAWVVVTPKGLIVADRRRFE